MWSRKVPTEAGWYLWKHRKNAMRCDYMVYEILVESVVLLRFAGRVPAANMRGWWQRIAEPKDKYDE